ncbi:hypothetical protein EDD16DRAFT_1724441 [Pisolithus croceorrhizus]|nr:hypothetical protein EDD16DRAFT_1724441 [Pisolithus croceorrhizus]
MTIPGGFGATLVGGLVSAMLYGITTLQTYVYYMHYSEDDSIIKFIVAAVWVLDTLHVAFMCHVLYYYLITNYGVLMSLEYVVWSFPASIMVNTLVITMVQSFFAHKIYHLCRHKVRWLVTAPIILLLVAQLGISGDVSTGFGTARETNSSNQDAATAVVTFLNNAVTYAAYIRFYTATPALATALLAEVFNTVSLCVLLYERGSRSAVPRTKRLLNTLIVYAVNRCVLTLLVVIAEVTMVRMTYCKTTMALSTFFQDANDIVAWTMALTWLSPKLYANSLLASLNTRQHLRSQVSGLESDQRVNAVRFASPPKLSGDTGSSKGGVQQFDECKVTVIDIATRGAFDEATTLRREAELLGLLAPASRKCCVTAGTVIYHLQAPRTFGSRCPSPGPLPLLLLLVPPKPNPYIPRLSQALPRTHPHKRQLGSSILLSLLIVLADECPSTYANSPSSGTKHTYAWFQIIRAVVSTEARAIVQPSWIAL